MNNDQLSEQAVPEGKWFDFKADNKQVVVWHKDCPELYFTFDAQSYAAQKSVYLESLWLTTTGYLAKRNEIVSEFGIEPTHTGSDIAFHVNGEVLKPKLAASGNKELAEQLLLQGLSQFLGVVKETLETVKLNQMELLERLPKGGFKVFVDQSSGETIIGISHKDYKEGAVQHFHPTNGREFLLKAADVQTISQMQIEVLNAAVARQDARDRQLDALKKEDDARRLAESQRRLAASRHAFPAKDPELKVESVIVAKIFENTGITLRGTEAKPLNGVEFRGAGSFMVFAYEGRDANKIKQVLKTCNVDYDPGFSTVRVNSFPALLALRELGANVPNSELLDRIANAQVSFKELGDIVRFNTECLDGVERLIDDANAAREADEPVIVVRTLEYQSVRFEKEAPAAVDPKEPRNLNLVTKELLREVKAGLRDVLAKAAKHKGLNWRDELRDCIKFARAKGSIIRKEVEAFIVGKHQTAEVMPNDFKTAVVEYLNLTYNSKVDVKHPEATIAEKMIDAINFAQAKLDRGSPAR